MARPKTVVVTPTYNEAENIERLLESMTGLNVEILVVDDDSPDGTAERVRYAMKKNKKVHLIVRKKKEGLGAAYVDGISYAMNKYRPEIIVQMDADGQHDPKVIPELLKQINKGADFVIGSRYTNGGSTEKGWGIHRKFASWCAQLVARFALGVKGVRDSTSGFRAVRAPIIRKIDLQGINTSGYAFLAAMLRAAAKEGANIKEVPITFGLRHAGKSKMGLSDMLEGIKLILRYTFTRK